MRNMYPYLSVVVLAGLIASGCTKEAPIAGPLGRPVTLLPPYVAYQSGDPSDKISVQYAVIAVARQAGLDYDWDTSFKNTDPICRQFIRPVIRAKSCKKALQMILRPVGLKYQIASGRIVLSR